MRFNLSKIVLRIKGNGNKKVFSSDANKFRPEYYPNKVKINGIENKHVNYTYYLNESDNFVELIWNKEINNCIWMFKMCSDISEIDLSNFNSSRVTNTWQMFLVSINLSNFNTSQVTIMPSMFNGCSSLISLNLFNFDTSKVINMMGMFGGCSSLTSLNLSNFNTSKTGSMQYMFEGCSSLISLDLFNFDT